ncbi:hypothetical protein [Deinococcus peraridilitoris]|uniref:hypothetical protein n=1 Tax=Deinococcus peraridilitoris TaxID=432329 RepID=UPI0003133EC4|nr:hypothetical protein [Deinococcus peraridilitoris]
MNGVPSGSTAQLQVSGPNNFSKSLATTASLAVKPGVYTVTANDLTSAGKTYRASLSSTSATVTAGKTASITATYALATASINELTATPAGLGAAGGALTLNWSGTNLGSNSLSVEPTLDVTGLPGGAISANSVTVNLPGNSGLTAMTYTFTLTSTSSSGGTVTRSITVTVASASKGALNLNVIGLPQDTGAEIKVTGSGGFSRTVTTTSNLTDLTPGSYTVSANSVSAGGLNYQPTVKGSPVNVQAGKSASVGVTYTQVPVSVSLSPKGVTMAPGDTTSFEATVLGAVDTGVIWTTDGGVISGSGRRVIYQAPGEPGTYHVTATSTADKTKQVTATVTAQANASVPNLSGIWVGSHNLERSDERQLLNLVITQDFQGNLSGRLHTGPDLWNVRLTGSLGSGELTGSTANGGEVTLKGTFQRDAPYTFTGIITVTRGGTPSADNLTMNLDVPGGEVKTPAPEPQPISALLSYKGNWVFGYSPVYHGPSAKRGVIYLTEESRTNGVITATGTRAVCDRDPEALDAQCELAGPASVTVENNVVTVLFEDVHPVTSYRSQNMKSSGGLVREAGRFLMGGQGTAIGGERDNGIQFQMYRRDR